MFVHYSYSFLYLRSFHLFYVNADVVHIGISYTEHFHTLYSRQRRSAKQLTKPYHQMATIGAMTDLGISVLGGGISSFGSSLFLLFCVIKYLNQFGEFMSLVIITSLFFSLLIYPSTLSIFGNIQWEYKCKNMCKKVLCCCCVNRAIVEDDSPASDDDGGDDETFAVEMVERPSVKRKVPETIDTVLNNGSGKDGELSNDEIMSWNVN
jgi:hypothetical protein